MKNNIIEESIYIGKLELTQQENDLLQNIKSFTIDLNEEHNKRLLKLENCFLLTQSLIERKALPEHRISYFISAEYRLSDTRSSRMEVFESNGTSGEAIFRHPHFLKYLKYFIYGADLPVAFKQQVKIIKEETFYHSDFVEQATPIIRIYYNANINKANRKAFAEEIFKLSLDLGLDLTHSAQLRNKVMKFNG